MVTPRAVRRWLHRLGVLAWAVLLPAVLAERAPHTVQYPWVKPLLDQNFTAAYVGQDARGPVRGVTTEHPMAGFYAQVIGSLIRRAAALFAVGGVG